MPALDLVRFGDVSKYAERWFGSGDEGDDSIDESDGEDMLEDVDRAGELSESSNDESAEEDAELMGLKLRVGMSGAS